MSSDEDWSREEPEFLRPAEDTPLLELSSRKSKRKQQFSKERRNSETRPNRRKVKTTSELICPLCQLTLRHGDVECHFTYEWEKVCKSLLKLSTQGSRQGSFSSAPQSSHSDLPQRASSVSSQSSSSTIGGRNTGHSSMTLDGDSSSLGSSTASVVSKDTLSQNLGHGFQSYKRVKVNRLLRLQSKRWQVKDMEDEALCPVCGESVPASTVADLQMHAEKCLRKQGEGEPSSDEEVEVEGDEYEWCGMRKIRITSLLKSQGQLDALGTLVEKGDEDANVEVCLVQEEEDGFGPSQYSQQDLDPPSGHSSEIEEESVDPPRTVSPMTLSSNSSDLDNFPFDASQEGRSEAESAVRPPSRPLVEALQFKIRELEERGSFICHICHGPYDVPLTSIVCWHVHCEKCWLQTLSSQKLCPQCKVIVSPKELRKIYL